MYVVVTNNGNLFILVCEEKLKSILISWQKMVFLKFLTEAKYLCSVF